MSIKRHKLRKNEKEYTPTNINKYVGQYPIITRSRWEQKVCQWLDLNQVVEEWSSEGHIIGYFDPITNKKRRYYPDFYAKINGKRYIIEVKPEKDLKPPPKRSKKSKKTLLTMETTFLRNKAKFSAAKTYCEKMGYEFMVLTERNLFRNKKGR